MAKKIVVDGVLQTWGDNLYRRAVKFTKGAADLKAPKKPSRQAGQGRALDAAAVRKKLDATVKKRPEVMVKITGSGKHIKQIKNHLDYISRNGEISLEDQDGEEIGGREAIRDLRDDWKNGRFVIPTEEGTKRETFNIVLSMPAGTDRQSVTNAARDFAKAHFGGRHDYVFATHTDDDHPHVHLIVRARDYDGKMMNPRKGDLQKWRETFAEKLGDHGIEANATKRKVRGVTRRPIKKTVLEAEKRGATLKNYRDPQTNPRNPRAGTIADTHEQVALSYAKIGTALNESELPEDRRLALRLASFVRDMPAERDKARGGREVVQPGPQRPDIEPGKSQ